MIWRNRGFQPVFLGSFDLPVAVGRVQSRENCPVSQQVDALVHMRIGERLAPVLFVEISVVNTESEHDVILWCEDDWPFPLGVSRVDDFPPRASCRFHSFPTRALFGIAGFVVEWIGCSFSGDSSILRRAALILPRWPFYMDLNSNNIFINVSQCFAKSWMFLPFLANLFLSRFQRFPQVRAVVFVHHDYLRVCTAWN